MGVAALMHSTRSNVGTDQPGKWQEWRPIDPSQRGKDRSEVLQRESAKPDYGPTVENSSPTERTNQEWLADLRGPGREEALADLRHILLTGLGYTLAGYGNIQDDDLEDFVQEALLRVMAKLDTFRGESRFTTWAQKIAVRVALSELRRKRWQDVSLDELTTGDSDTAFVPSFLADLSAGPEKQAIQHILLERLERIIAEELSERQGRALVAVHIHGMPLEETARTMGTNRNALYKLLHDARRRLKERLLLRGISAQEMLAFFSNAETFATRFEPGVG